MSFVYFFGSGYADGNASMKSELGGKGANLAEMTALGLPVPAGFTISTRVCLDYIKEGSSFSKELILQVESALKKTEEAMGAKFADSLNPLLVSVRSGARVSMPGMMDTVLNLGLNEITVEALSKKTENPRFAYDSYRRFIQMYSSVVKDLETHYMEDELESYKKQCGYKEDTELTASDLKELIVLFKSIYQKHIMESFPEDPYEQLWNAIGAVFKSWNCPRAKKYREIHSISNDWGTAVNICSMVYGNMGETSGTGVCFTRDPSTGENIFYGEFLINAQGEDVVAGLRTPKSLYLLEKEMPEVFVQLESVRSKLERHYQDVQDIEFTIQESKLYILQTRNAKRTTQAALKIAIDFTKEGLLTKEEAILRVNAQDLDKLLHPTLDPRAHKQIIAKGLPASPGAVSGRVVFTALEAESWAARGELVILVRDETSPEDIGGMYSSQGFLTARGGMTSHAAVVARQMGKCCIAGCSSLNISQTLKSMKVAGIEILEGDWLTLDGTTGEVMIGKVETKNAELSGDFTTFMEWAREIRTMKVRANADTPRDAQYARSFGAEGIGLCRTEHMFFEENRLPVVRQMILSKNNIERKLALDKLLPFQRDDFVGILSAMEGFEVTIRLLDPPLHEFLPHTDKDMMILAAQLGLSLDDLGQRVRSLHEANPMLGHRGCRLGISHPEIYEMQVRAILEATEICKAQGKKVYPEIMIPLVGIESELKWLRERLVKIAPHFPFGTMIEVPRAALTADKISRHADFFSFGTNDLTQTTYGFSRDDSAPFLRVYKQESILEEDPFAVIDQDGVGRLIKYACELGRQENPNIKLGICGEHGGEPSSVQFCNSLGLNYVSCSPFRIPIAMLAAAQAAVGKQMS
ncbi:pyruvate, phosphate dikinase [Fluviispira multicolorata]|uniref:Pyruvate, phosphate dikinase n=1 Tax=Fluviispira multicolorata TaxID=2654512 RepID=A0A833N793_9BACT|nr:pyruvate, phosphate dikinase [Fluviispira multicolorata]KAB8031945.1 pyruvate, phosphate dikinase [Fluviispira multicolorata]